MLTLGTPPHSTLRAGGGSHLIGIDAVWPEGAPVTQEIPGCEELGQRPLYVRGGTRASLAERGWQRWGRVALCAAGPDLLVPRLLLVPTHRPALWGLPVPAVPPSGSRKCPGCHDPCPRGWRGVVAGRTVWPGDPGPQASAELSTTAGLLRGQWTWGPPGAGSGRTPRSDSRRWDSRLSRSDRVLQRFASKSRALVPTNVTLFGNKVPADMTK